MTRLCLTDPSRTISLLITMTNEVSLDKNGEPGDSMPRSMHRYEIAQWLADGGTIIELLKKAAEDSDLTYRDAL